MESHPTHAYNFLQEAKKEGKVRLAHKVKPDFWKNIWKWSNIKTELSGLLEGFEPSYLGFVSTLKGQF